jgi:nitroimidazol reductase NimA-like FMN-containing flavoprotein (pyridoxamine 5'-phosphate oxidase superfamily)
LLESTTVGRLGYTSERGPRIIPVNYAVRPDSVAFRTGQQTEVARLALGRIVAFEVDHVDDFLRSGWSVLVVGKLAEMSPSAVRMLNVSQTPDPWAGGERTLFCEIPFEQLSGRRIHPG